MNYYIDTEFNEYHKQHKICGINIGKAIPTIDLISIGIVSEDIKLYTYPTKVFGKPLPKVLESTKSRSYYAISKDFNIKDAWNNWQWDKLTDEELALMTVKTRRKGFTLMGTTNMLPRGSYWLRDNVLKPIFKELWKKNIFNNKGYVNTNDYIDNKFTYNNFKYLINKYGKSNKEIAEEIRKFVYYSYSDNQIKNANINFYSYYADYDWVVFAQLFGKMINLPKGFPKYCKDLKQDLDNLAYKHYPLGIELRGFDEAIDDIKNHKLYPKQDNEHNALDNAKWNKKLHEFIKSL